MYAQTLLTKNCVTPYAGVWIEIKTASGDFYTEFVTPYAGVWIEIQ